MTRRWTIGCGRGTDRLRRLAGVVLWTGLLSVPLHAAPEPLVWGIEVDPVEGMVWAGQGPAVLTFRGGGEGKARRIPLGGAKDRPLRTAFAFVKAGVYFLADGSLYFLPRDGATVACAVTGKEWTPTLTGVSGLASFGDLVFAALDGKGLVLMKREKPVYWPEGDGIPPGTATTLAAGPAGLVVVQKDRLSVHRFDPPRWVHQPIPGLEGAYTIRWDRQVRMSGSSLLVATRSSVDRLDLASGGFEKILLQEQQSPATPHAFIEAGGEILLGTHMGFYRRTGKGWVHQSLGASPYDFLEDGPATWIGIFNSRGPGLIRMDTARKTFRRYFVRTRSSDEGVWCLAADEDRVYVGTHDGPAWLDKRTGVAHPVTIGEGAP